MIRLNIVEIKEISFNLNISQTWGKLEYENQCNWEEDKIISKLWGENLVVPEANIRAKGGLIDRIPWVIGQF